MYHTLFFDLDNTLYPPDCGVWEAIGARIEKFVIDNVNIEEEKVSEFRQYCHDKYGTTLQGLKRLYQVDDEQYLKYVHDIDLSQYLVNDGQISKLLDSLPQRKIIFTNSDENHASKVLRFLEIEEQFEMIIDVTKLDPYVKPQKGSFQRALELTGLRSANSCVFIDDFQSNVEGANEMGFFSILVGKKQDSDYPYQISDIYGLPKFLNGHAK